MIEYEEIRPGAHLFNGRSEEVLAQFAENCIDLTVTSPPYDELRKNEHYNHVFDFETIAGQLFRITRPGGVVVWVVGDQTLNGDESGTSFRQALHFKEIGFKLHDTMIYDKNGPKFPHDNLYHQVFEYMFVFVKPGGPLTFNEIIDRKAVWSDNHLNGHQKREQDGSLSRTAGTIAPAGRLGRRFNIWRYSGTNAQGDKMANGHPAIFPERLARDHIASWSNAGDTVLDPFCGSGTTMKEAVQLGRKTIGIELSPQYCKLIRRRVTAANAPLFV